MATATQISSFIDQIAPLIQKEAKKRGYKVCSPAIAQACCESAFNTSSLGYRYCNYFGLKCGSKWKGKSINLKTKEEYTVGTLTTIKDNFRVYDSMEEGVKGYYDFISTKRYANLKTAETPLQYLEFIKADGYATSSTYVQTNMNIITKYNLTKYDDTEIPANGNPYKLTVTLLKRGMKGESVAWLQYNLNRCGANLKIDSDFGRLTLTQVLRFQQTHNDVNGKKLVVDGICGAKTIAALKIASNSV